MIDFVFHSGVFLAILSRGLACDENFRKLVCKPDWSGSSKTIEKWLQKMRKNPHCLITRYEDDFTGPEEIREDQSDRLINIYYTVNGEKHGVSVSYIDTTRACMSAITVYRRNVEVGPRWDLSMGHINPLLASTINMPKISGYKVWGGGAIYNNSIWLYPDLTTLLVGEFDDDRLVSGREAKIGRVRCRHGVLELESAAIDNEIQYTYESYSETGLSSSPTVQDPYEFQTVRVELSRLGGEGLFARKALPKERLVSYFHGFKITRDTLKENWLSSKGNSILCETERKAEYLQRNSYIIALNEIHDLDMPPDVGADCNRYNATLGHKANHEFFPNCFFGWAIHPRFGSVRGLFTLREIEKGEELTVDYGYDYNGEDTPNWYKELYDKTFKF